MEIETSTSAVAKKLWSIVRIMAMMMRKGVSKSKLMMELHQLLKRGKLAGRAMAESFILHYGHHSASAFSCRSDDALSFVAPREYEFSCSNSPALPRLSRRGAHKHASSRPQYDDVSTTVTAVHKMLEMYCLNNNTQINNNNNNSYEENYNSNYYYNNYGSSPAVVGLPGFGRSPMPAVRQLRITDSPFPIESVGDSQVDVKAEDFIKRFYKSLRAQKRSMSYLESPYREVYG